MNKCPRCKNQEVREDHNFCEICGLDLRNITREIALMQLKDLLYNFQNFVEVETTEEDVQALKYAINELEKTAQEAPVQEQYVTLKIDGSEIAKVVIDEIRKQQKSEIRIRPV